MRRPLLPAPMQSRSYTHGKLGLEGNKQGVIWACLCSAALVQSLCNITSFVLTDKQAKLAISKATVSDWPFCLFLIGLHLGNQKWRVNGLLTSPCCVSPSVFVIMYLQAHLEPSYYMNLHFQKLLFKSQYVSIGRLLWHCHLTTNHLTWVKSMECLCLPREVRFPPTV